jgi:hypothetical protein
MNRTVVLFCTIFFLFSFDSPQYTWVAIGDSITYLNDHQNETGNRIHKGYMTLVTEELPQYQYVNQGHNGWTAIRIAESIDKLGIQKADLYSVFLGTNDWWQGKPLGTLTNYEQNTGSNTVMGAFRMIINKLRSLNPDAKIILITPMQRVDFVYINNFKNNAFGSYREKSGQQLEQFANAILTIGKNDGIAVIDLYHSRKLRHARLVKFKHLKDPSSGIYKNYKWPVYIDVPFDAEKDEYPYPEASINMTYDGLHPSDKGYELISKMFIKCLRG